MIFLLNDLACFSFRSAAAAEPVQQSLQKNVNPHRGSGQADIDEGQIESGNKKWRVFLCVARAVVLSRACNEVGHGAARARFLAAFARSKAVPPEAGAFMTCATPSRRWPCKTAWTSRPSAVCWVTTRRASRWTLTPTSPPMRNSKRRKQWAISYPVRSDGFRYPLPLGSAFGSEKSGVRK